MIIWEFRLSLITIFWRVSYLQMSKENDTKTIAQVSDMASGPLVLWNYLLLHVLDSCINIFLQVGEWIIQVSDGKFPLLDMAL